jgi:hypothetical protein
MHTIDVRHMNIVRRLIIEELEASTATDTYSMVRKQCRSICNIYKLIRRR